MIKYLLDTDICIFTIKNKPQGVRDAFTRHEGRLAINTVTLMELVYGAEKSNNAAKNMRVVEGFAARLEVLDYNPDAANHTAQIRAELARAGTPIGPYDAMIAGQARALGLVLVTNNVREFSRVAGLRIENWLAPKP